MTHEDEKPELRVHVGFHKTGSSTVQMALSAQADSADARFLYPVAGRLAGWPHAHHQLVQDLKFGRTDSLDATVSEWRANPEQVTVLSCEDLSALENAHLLAHLVRAFPDHRVTAVAVLRPHVDWFRSIYLERVKRGESQLLPMPYFVEHWNKLRFSAVIDTFAACGCAVEAHAYADMDLPGGLVERLTRAPLTVDVDKRHNVSLSPLMTMALREHFGRHDKPDIHATIRQAYRLDQLLSAEDKRSDIYTKADINRIENYLNHDRTALERRFGPDVFGSLSGQPTLPKGPLIDFSANAAEEILSRILQPPAA